MLAAGRFEMCAVVDGGSVVCWGDLPKTVAGVTGATAISLRPDAACAIVAGGHVVCWGKGDPVEVPGIEGATSIASSDNHTCVRTAAGEVRCWGSTADGKLGPNALPTSSEPSVVKVGD
jgi:hypothetical protein